MLNCEPPFDIATELGRVAHQHPLIVHQSAGDGSACSISDLVSARDFRRREVYLDLLRHVSGEDQLAVSFRGDDDVLVGASPSTWVPGLLGPLTGPGWTPAARSSSSPTATSSTARAC